MKTLLPGMFFFFLVLPRVNSQDIKFYISPHGNDTGPGTSEKPFASLSRARDAIRSLKKNGELNKPVTVFLRDGIYELKETFTLKPEDSGSQKYPVTYCAFPGETPVICGSRKVESAWKVYRDKIMVSTINTGLKQDFKQLFANGKRKVRARTPNSSYYLADMKGSDPGSLKLKFREGDSKNLQNVLNAELVLLNMTDESRLIISAVNNTEKTLSFTGPHGGRKEDPQYFLFTKRYFLENALQFLDSPGEWYFSSVDKKLYYWPESPVDKSEIRYPVLKQLLKVEGSPAEKKYVSYIIFSGLTFTDTDWSMPSKGFPSYGDFGDIVMPSAITLYGTSHCIFKDNIIRNTGTYAFEMTGFANQITNNEIFAAGAGGIITRSYEAEPNIISYNSIHDCGQIFQASSAILVDDGGGTISHNLISELPWSGISTRFTGTGSRQEKRKNQLQALKIEFNEISKVSQILNDGAGIYVSDSNVVIRNNLITDAIAPANGIPGRGIALYAGTSGSVIENNIVNRAAEALFVGPSCSDNFVTNNIFAGSDDAMIKICDETTTKRRNVKLTRNIFYFGSSDAYIYSNTGKNPVPSESDYNLYWSPYRCLLLCPVIRGVPDVDYIADWRNKGLDQNSIVIDPKFVNDKSGDFTLKKGSPAFKVGFKPIDISTVGLRGTKH